MPEQKNNVVRNIATLPRLVVSLKKSLGSRSEDRIYSCLKISETRASIDSNLDSKSSLEVPSDNIVTKDEFSIIVSSTISAILLLVVSKVQKVDNRLSSEKVWRKNLDYFRSDEINENLTGSIAQLFSGEEKTSSIAEKGNEILKFLVLKNEGHQANSPISVKILVESISKTFKLDTAQSGDLLCLLTPFVVSWLGAYAKSYSLSANTFINNYFKDAESYLELLPEELKEIYHYQNYLRNELVSVQTEAISSFHEASDRIKDDFNEVSSEERKTLLEKFSISPKLYFPFILCFFTVFLISILYLLSASLKIEGSEVSKVEIVQKDFSNHFNQESTLPTSKPNIDTVALRKTLKNDNLVSTIDEHTTAVKLSDTAIQPSNESSLNSKLLKGELSSSKSFASLEELLIPGLIFGSLKDPVLTENLSKLGYLVGAAKKKLQHSEEQDAGKKDISLSYVNISLPQGRSLKVRAGSFNFIIYDYLKNVKAVKDESALFNLSGLTFSPGSSSLIGDSRQRISSLAIILKSYPDKYLKIEGHTDNSGSSVDNQVLSEKRADKVRSILIENGIEPNRIRTLGFGDRSPIFSNSTLEGRRKNRRVDLQIIS